MRQEPTLTNYNGVRHWEESGGAGVASGEGRGDASIGVTKCVAQTNGVLASDPRRHEPIGAGAVSQWEG
jgi:hypothetical protein